MNIVFIIMNIVFISLIHSLWKDDMNSIHFVKLLIEFKDIFNHLIILDQFDV